LILIIGTARGADNYPNTDEGLVQCLKAKTFYTPTILHKQTLGTDEYEKPLEQDSCIRLILPDRLGGIGIVGEPAGTVIIRDRATNQAKRLKACNNRIPGGLVVPRPATSAIAGPLPALTESSGVTKDFTPSSPQDQPSWWSNNWGWVVVAVVVTVAAGIAVACSGSGGDSGTPPSGNTGGTPPGGNTGNAF